MHFDYENKDDRGFYKIAVPLIKAYANVHFSISCYGKENIPKEKGRLIVACNHISFVDPAVIISHFPYSIHFMFISISSIFPSNPIFIGNILFSKKTSHINYILIYPANQYKIFSQNIGFI